MIYTLTIPIRYEHVLALPSESDPSTASVLYVTNSLLLPQARHLVGQDVVYVDSTVIASNLEIDDLDDSWADELDEIQVAMEDHLEFVAQGPDEGIQLVLIAAEVEFHFQIESDGALTVDGLTADADWDIHFEADAEGASVVGTRIASSMPNRLAPTP